MALQALNVTIKYGYIEAFFPWHNYCSASKGAKTRKQLAITVLPRLYPSDKMVSLVHKRAVLSHTPALLAWHPVAQSFPLFKVKP